LVHNFPKGIISKLSPREYHSKIHCSNHFSLPLKYLQRLQNLGGSLMLGLDFLAGVAKINILSNISLHSISPTCCLKISVHLIPSWVNGQSRLVSLSVYLTFNSLMSSTQILPLYHNTPSSSSVNPGDFSSLISHFIFLIFSSSS
jgi:hypothetical protein